MLLTFTLLRPHLKFETALYLKPSTSDLDTNKLFKSLCIWPWGYYPGANSWLLERDLGDARLEPAIVSWMKCRFLCYSNVNLLGI